MSDVRERLKLPAMGLILVGSINALTGLMLIVGRLVSLLKGTPAPTDPDRRLGYMTWNVLSPVLGLLSLLAAPLIIYGAIQMFGAKRYPAARLAAVLALIPISSVCCVPGIPVGIWALMVLLHPEVKVAFFNSQEGS
jgi:hypothetical protein